MIEILQHVLQTPFLFSSLGFITAIAIFISPVLYNGDYKMATKTVVVLGIFVFFSSLLNYSHLNFLENRQMSVWSQPILLEAFIAISYTLGLFIGIYINRKVRNY